MKVLVLNGSPHADGNTVAMIGAFAKGAESNGHEVTVFDVAKKKIAGCMACEYCHTTGGGECVQKFAESACREHKSVTVCERGTRRKEMSVLI